MRKYSLSTNTNINNHGVGTLLYFYSPKELRMRIVTFLMLIDQTSKLMVYGIASGNILEDFTPFLTYFCGFYDLRFFFYAGN